MPKTKISEYSTTNSDNTDIESINIAEGCAPSGINNAIRELMVHLKEFQTGASGDAFTFAGGVLISGTANTITGNVLMSGTNTITGSTTATFAAGAVGTPSIAAHGDTNTGIFFPAADTIAFSEGGVESMRIDSSGNVGIGTSSPYSASSQKSVSISGSAVARLDFYNGATHVADIDSYSGGGTGLDVRVISNLPLVFHTNNAERMRITSGGYFKASDNGTYFNSTGSQHEFRQSANSDTLRVVNVNTSNASDILQVRAARNTTNNSFYSITYYNDGAGAYKLQVADSGNITNTNGSYGTISDAKLKQDIVDAGSQWDDIKNLRFRKYRLKSEVELDPNAKPFLGLIAQEAELVSPGLIEEHKDTKQEIKTREVEKTREIPAVLDDEGNEVTPAITETYTETEEYTETVDLGTTTKSIKTSILYMKAVKALQEAMTRIEALEAEVAAMKAGNGN